MYAEAYHLTADPFRLSPDHRFCYRHKSYATSKAYLDYALARREGFVMITGAPGSGKTTLLNDVLANVDNGNSAVARIVTTQLDATCLLRMAAFSFNLDSEKLDKAGILHRLESFLVKQYRLNRHSLLVIDEAQDLDKTALEEIRLLTNLQIEGNSLLQVFLVGQDNLLAMIQDPNMEQLHQRLIASSHLEAMKADETEIYVIHRLRMAGWERDPLISRGALRSIHIFSNGVPRIINQLCSRFLLYGCAENKHQLDNHDAQEVIKELCHEHMAPLTGNFSAGTLFGHDSLNEGKDALDKYDQEFLDSSAFSDKPTPGNIMDQSHQTAKVQQIADFTPASSERRDMSRMTESKMEIHPVSPVSPGTHSPRKDSGAIEDTQRASAFPSKVENPQAIQEMNHRNAAKPSTNRQSYALLLFLILLCGLFLFILPVPTGKLAAPLAKQSIPEKVSNPPQDRVTQNKKVEPTSIQHNIQNSIKNNLTRHALYYSQTGQGNFRLQLNVEDQFSWGSAIMSHALQLKMSALAEALRDQPQAIIHIIGHSDPTGSQARNKLLSDLRAKVVANFLVMRGIPQYKLTTDGRGSSELVSTDNPPANRRVDLLIETINPNSAT